MNNVKFLWNWFEKVVYADKNYVQYIFQKVMLFNSPLDAGVGLSSGTLLQKNKD